MSTTALPRQDLKGGKRPAGPTLPPKLRRELKIKKKANEFFGVRLFRFGEGVYVTCIFSGSPAWRVGLSIGDRVEEACKINLFDAETSTLDVTPILKERSDVKLRVAELAIFRTVIVVRENEEDELGIDVFPKLLSWHAVQGQATDKALVTMGVSTSNTTVLEICGVPITGISRRKIVAMAEKQFQHTGHVELTLAPRLFVMEVQYQLRLKAAAAQLAGVASMRPL